MAAKDEHLLVGGDDGSFTYMNLETSAKPILGGFSDADYMEVNGMEISRSRTGGKNGSISLAMLGLKRITTNITTTTFRQTC